MAAVAPDVPRPVAATPVPAPEFLPPFKAMDVVSGATVECMPDLHPLYCFTPILIMCETLCTAQILSLRAQSSLSLRAVSKFWWCAANIRHKTHL